MPEQRPLNGLELIDALTRHNLNEGLYVSGYPILGVDYTRDGMNLDAPDIPTQEQIDTLDDTRAHRDSYLEALHKVTTELEKMLNVTESRPQAPEIHMGVETMLEIVRAAIGAEGGDNEIPF